MKKIFFAVVQFFIFTAYCYAVDSTSITDKVICGYQGWFNCKGDGSPTDKEAGIWRHWTIDNKQSPKVGNTHFDVYPDTSEYQSASLFQTGYANLGNGQPAKLFSSYSDNVISLHFKWMQQYGIDGVALQRFGTEIRDIRACNNCYYTDTRNEIASKVRNEAEKFGRVFYIGYDVSGMSETTIERKTEFTALIKNDWTDEITKLNLTSSSQYCKQNGKNVVGIWGIGVDKRPGTPEQFLDLIKWFKEKGCYVIGGVPANWREKKDYENVYNQLDMISPWTVGVYTNLESIDNYKNSTLIPDRNYCSEHGIAYQPVIFPGFSWSNWIKNEDPNINPEPNQIPRLGGNFLWRQAYNIASEGINTAYIAMFDEYDEGTAIAKAAEDSSMIPNNNDKQYFVTLSADGIYMSSDFYLRLAGKITKLIKGEEHIDSFQNNIIPIPYINGDVLFRTGMERGFNDTFDTVQKFYNLDVQSKTDTIDSQGGGINNIIGYAGNGNPECGIVNETYHNGIFAIRYSGRDTSELTSFCYFKAFDVNIPVSANTKLSFWIYPQQELGRYVSVDLVLNDGSTLRDSGAVDYDGISLHPTAGRGKINTWSKISCNIGNWLNGKIIERIMIGYDKGVLTGDFRGYIDDILITNGMIESNQSDTPNIDSALIIDFSGSMSSNDPNNNRLEAARFFIDRAEDNDYLAVIDFEDNAYVSSEKGTIRIVKDNRENLKQAVVINGSSGGGTDISSGLQLGYDQLTKSPTNNQKIAILLTDGKGDYNDEAQNYAQKGWRIFTIGLSDNADENLLEEIASVTGGEYFKVTTDETARNAITEIYKRINRTVHKSEQTIHEENITVLPGQIIEKIFEVLQGTLSLWVDRIIPGSDVEMSLIQPDGRVIDRTTSDPDVYHALGTTYEIYRITSPVAGQWKAVLKGTDVKAEGEPTNLSIAVRLSDNPVSAKPVANAGADQTVDEDSLVTLSGLNDSPSSGTVSYLWEQIASSPDWMAKTKLSDSTVPNPTFTAPQVGEDNGSVTFRLTLKDQNGNQSSDTCTVHIINHGEGDINGSCFIRSISDNSTPITPVFFVFTVFIFLSVGDFRSLIFRVKSLFRKKEEGVVIVEREEFAKEMKEKFRGNTELLKALEKGLNKYAKKNEYISLTE